jgi:hypothetical protein
MLNIGGLSLFWEALSNGFAVMPLPYAQFGGNSSRLGV